MPGRQAVEGTEDTLTARRPDILGMTNRLEIGIERDFVLRIFVLYATHHTGFLIFSYTFFEEVGLARKRNQLHEIEGIC